MSERNYYVICEDKCLFPSMTAEQIMAAIASATGNIPEGIDDAFITKVLSDGTAKNISFWFGSEAQYNALDPQPEVTNLLMRVDGNGKIYICIDDNSTTSVPTTAITDEEIRAIVARA